MAIRLATFATVPVKSVCSRREEDQQGNEAKAGTKPAQAAREDSLQPARGLECGNHRHLQRPVKDRDMPKRKPGSLAASNNFLEVADNFLDFVVVGRLAMR